MCLLERDLCLVASEGLEVRDPRLDSRAVPVPGSAPGSAPGVANDRAGLPDARRPELTPRGQEAASVPCSRRGRSEVGRVRCRRRPAGCRASGAPGRRRSRLRCGGWRSALRTAGVDVRRVSSRRSVQRRGGRHQLTEAVPAYRRAGGLAQGVVPPPDFESCGRPRPGGCGSCRSTRRRLPASCRRRGRTRPRARSLPAGKNGTLSDPVGSGVRRAAPSALGAGSLTTRAGVAQGNSDPFRGWPPRFSRSAVCAYSRDTYGSWFPRVSRSEIRRVSIFGVFLSRGRPPG